MSKAVLNSSVIIALSTLGYLNKLKTLFKEILIAKAVYDSDGNKLPLDPKHKIYFVSNDLPGLTRRTTKDIKPGETPLPNRRTYGPALSGFRTSFLTE